MNTFSFKSPRQVTFGPGTSEALESLILGDDSGRSEILLISDKGVSRAGLLDRIKERTGRFQQNLYIIDDVPTEPYEEDIQSLFDRCTGKSIRQIIALGGGSVLDTAKLVALFLKNGGTARGFREALPTVPGVPVIMIPTTAGTGSEATPNSIIALRKEEVKVGIISEYFMPDNVILDPELTLTLPPAITAAGGVDTFCHLLECFISKKSNPYSDNMALEGMNLVLNNLKTAYTKGDSIEARSAMLLGSYYGGACIASSGTTAVHALSYPLGGKFRIAHGVSNAILLVPVFKFIADAIGPKLTRAAEAAGLSNTTPEYFMEYLANLVEELGIPSSVKEFGVKASDLGYLAEKSFGIRRLLDSTPKELSIEDIKTIYKEVL
ncbi:MAG: iron-containing alcohol dehydrogenase [Spirochaetales bacterium]|nr:iron-containing alcohol dehydrogenase [Spirochaetales bacterium]